MIQKRKTEKLCGEEKKLLLRIDRKDSLKSFFWRNRFLAIFLYKQEMR